MSTGWVQNNGYWYYLNPNASRPGQAQTGWLQIGGAWHFFQSNGAMSTGWFQSNGYWYYLNPDASRPGQAQTGWQDIGGARYYFQSNGAMITGWVQLNGYWYYLNPNSSRPGQMSVNWQQISGAWYYFQSNGVMKADFWQTDSSGRYYYLKPDGRMKPEGNSTRDWVNVWAVGAYLSCAYGSLGRVDDLAYEIKNSYTGASITITENLSATKSHILDNINQADMAFFIGHGPRDPVIRFHLSKHPIYGPLPQNPGASLCNEPGGNIYRSELRLGGQLEFATFHTCSFLRYTNQTEKQDMMRMMDGVHVMTGYDNRMMMWPGQMDYYVQLLKSGYSVYDAWKKSTSRFQKTPTEVDGDVFGMIAFHK